MHGSTAIVVEQQHTTRYQLWGLNKDKDKDKDALLARRNLYLYAI